MANLNFPTATFNGQTFFGSNGITYQWDGEKWGLYVDGNASQASLWARSAAATDIYPSNLGDDVNARNGLGNITASLNSDGSIDFITANLESLPSLP
jgi:hypothetical protein